MSNEFKIEIITPEKTILKSEVKEVIIPAFEGQLGILKDHIPLITFLRPGLISVNNQEERKFFVEEGTVEFSNNNLLILTSSIRDVQHFDNNSINKLIELSKIKIKDEDITDKEKYILSYKIDTLNGINR